MIDSVCVQASTEVENLLYQSNLNLYDKQRNVDELEKIRVDAVAIRSDLQMSFSAQRKNWIDLFIRIAQIGYSFDKNFAFPYRLFVFRNSGFLNAMRNVRALIQETEQKPGVYEELLALEMQYYVHYYYLKLLGTDVEIESQLPDILEKLNQITIEVSHNTESFDHLFPRQYH